MEEGQQKHSWKEPRASRQHCGGHGNHVIPGRTLPFPHVLAVPMLAAAYDAATEGGHRPQSEHWPALSRASGIDVEASRLSYKACNMKVCPMSGQKSCESFKVRREQLLRMALCYFYLRFAICSRHLQRTSDRCER